MCALCSILVPTYGLILFFELNLPFIFYLYLLFSDFEKVYELDVQNNCKLLIWFNKFSPCPSHSALLCPTLPSSGGVLGTIALF